MFLDRIVAQTREDVEKRKQETPLEEAQRLAAAQPSPRDLLAALGHSLQARLIAEVKRASPSKGLLAEHFDAVALARLYEASGAATISVLTEPHFFLGSPEYLTAVKRAVRVPVLCKDFILDEYQVYEARAWGADAILLICALLDDSLLRRLLSIAHGLHMRCLVEVHNAEEARRAVTAGAAIIGVNSRDLRTFRVNPYLIRDLRPLIPRDCVVVAESGIATPADARRLARYDVQAMLVGESLMVSNDIAGQARALLQGANESVQVKICGLSDAGSVQAAVEAGADMIGFVFYKPGHRYVQPSAARALLANRREWQTAPDVVGVFVNEDADTINTVVEQVGLDFVQLHGNESPDFCRRMQRPVLKGLGLRGRDDLGRVKAYMGTAWRALLDTPTTAWGGSGETHDWKLAREAARDAPIMLAGGLTPDNIATAIEQVRPWGVDVSSGIETNKQKDVAKIRAFVKNVRCMDIKE